MSEEQEPYRTRIDMSKHPDRMGGELSETPMKIDLKQSGNRHARKLIKKLSEGGYDLPDLVHDSIRQEFEYATMDGYRITMRHQSETESDNDNTDQDRFNR